MFSSSVNARSTGRPQALSVDRRADVVVQDV
jgi:hypothetical protein